MEALLISFLRGFTSLYIMNLLYFPSFAGIGIGFETEHVNIHFKKMELHYQFASYEHLELAF